MQNQTRPSRGSDQASTRPHSILIVEDDPDTREILEELLVERHHRVGTAADGYEAVEKLEQESWDLILLDIRLPHLDGLEVARIAQSRLELPRIILMTAYPTWYYNEDAKDIRAAAVFAKPFNLNSLAGTVDAVLEEAPGGTPEGR